MTTNKKRADPIHTYTITVKGEDANRALEIACAIGGYKSIEDLMAWTVSNDLDAYEAVVTDIMGSNPTERFYETGLISAAKRGA